MVVVRKQKFAYPPTPPAAPRPKFVAQKTVAELDLHLVELRLPSPGVYHSQWGGAGKAKVQAEGRCRACGRPSSVRPLTRHHIVPLAAFTGLDAFRFVKSCDQNIVPLCRPCHDGVELDAASRAMFRRCLVQEEVAFAIQVAGKAWFDARYPPRSSSTSRAA